MGAQTAARLAVICTQMVEHLPDLTIGEEEAGHLHDILILFSWSNHDDKLVLHDKVYIQS